MSPQEHKIERRLAAIFAADVAGYSRLMSQDEVGTLQPDCFTRNGGPVSSPNMAGGSPIRRGQCARGVPQRRRCRPCVPSKSRRRSRKQTRTSPRTIASNSGSGFTLAT